MLHARPFWELLKTTALEWWNDNTFRMAAALAFYTIFSIAPVIMIATGLAGLLLGQERAVRQVAVEVQSLVGGQSGQVIRELALSLPSPKQQPMAATVGFVTLVIGSTVVFAELQSALNQVWDVRASPERGVIKGLLHVRLRSFLIALAVGFLLLVSLVLSAGISGMHAYLDSRVTSVAWIWRLLTLAASFLVTMGLFMLIYRYLPDVKITWSDVTVGAGVTAFLFTIGKSLIGIYLGRMAIGSTYGAAGSFAVLLVWVYYSALICFFGAEFTQVYARRYGSRLRPQPHAVRVGEKTDQV